MKAKICTECYEQFERPKSKTSGSILIELLAWCMFVMPGLIYSLWRLTTRRKVCPSCASPRFVAVNSPRGKVLVAQVRQQNAAAIGGHQFELTL